MAALQEGLPSRRLQPRYEPGPLSPGLAFASTFTCTSCRAGSAMRTSCRLPAKLASCRKSFERQLTATSESRILDFELFHHQIRVVAVGVVVPAAIRTVSNPCSCKNRCAGDCVTSTCRSYSLDAVVWQRISSDRAEQLGRISVSPMSFLERPESRSWQSAAVAVTSIIRNATILPSASSDNRLGSATDS